MFGMSFGEILIIAIIGIVFLGPEKLPKMMVQVAKFFNSFKRSVADVKETLNNELKVDELQRGALEYKNKFQSTKKELTSFTTDIAIETNDIRKNITDIADLNIDVKKDESTKKVEEIKKDV